MKYTPKYSFLILGFALFFNSQLFAQEGTVTVNQNPEIKKLLTLKKEVNKSGKSLNLLTIQICSGSLTEAENAKATFLKKVGTYSTDLSYETPYYKVRVGRFKSRLEADKALLKIKRVFADAFILNPKKDK